MRLRAHVTYKTALQVASFEAMVAAATTSGLYTLAKSLDCIALMTSDTLDSGRPAAMTALGTSLAVHLVRVVVKTVL